MSLEFREFELNSVLYQLMAITGHRVSCHCEHHTCRYRQKRAMGIEEEEGHEYTGS